MRILVITSEWPTPEHPEWVPFLVQRVHFLREAGMEVSVFSFRGRRNPVNYGRAWFRLRRSHLVAEYDVLDAQFGQSGLLALPTSKPFVVTFHGSDLQGFVGQNGRPTRAGWLLQRVSRFIATRATKVILVSPHLAQYLPAKMPFEVIPCGLDMSLFRPLSQSQTRQQLGLPQDKKLVLFAANPANPIKRYALAKQAVRLLPASLKAHLVTISKIPHQQMPLYLNACDVLLLTSQHEGSPTIVKEALACNLPIVSTDVGDVRQRIGHIPGCVVCSEASPQMLASALTAVLRGEERIAGRSAVQELDETKLVQKLIGIYEQVAACT